MNKIKFVLACLLFSAVTALAESPATTNDPVYVVDLQKVVMESVMGKAARNAIEEEIKKKQLLMEKARMDLDKMKQDIEKQSSLISAEALSGKQDALMKKQRDFERQYQDLREEISKRNQEAMAKVIAKVDQLVKDIAREKSYKFVFEKDSTLVVYVNEKYDISNEVIKALNSQSAGL